jgi:hypothetical protein
MLQGLGTVVGAGAVIIAAKIGADTFQTWTRQKLAERRIEQAERILTAAYNARRALSYVRGMMVWAHELHAAEEKLKEDQKWATLTKDRQKRLTMAQALFNRLNKTSDDQSALSQCLPMARALFGEGLEAVLEKLAQQFWMVQVDVEAYVDDEGHDKNFSAKIRRGMYDIQPHNGEVNEISTSIAEAVAEIEATCLPILRGTEGGQAKAPGSAFAKMAARLGLWGRLTPKPSAPAT